MGLRAALRPLCPNWLQAFLLQPNKIRRALAEKPPGSIRLLFIVALCAAMKFLVGTTDIRFYFRDLYKRGLTVYQLVGRMASMDRKEEILDVATELVQTRGYIAFSYQDLSDRLGITKASIHYHFPSKDELGKAVAKRYSQQTMSYLAGVQANSDDPWERLDGYLDMVLAVMATRDRICAAGSVQSEINVVPAAMGNTMTCSTGGHWGEAGAFGAQANQGDDGGPRMMEERNSGIVDDCHAGGLNIFLVKNSTY